MEILTQILQVAETIPNKYIVAGSVILGALIRFIEKRKLVKKLKS